MELAYADQEIISRDYIASLLKQVDGIVDQAVQLAYGKPAHKQATDLMKKF
ncbi:MAG: hypothetical protein IPK10_18650 [Bacteroidetes bacterium]|nr:hypothetical protein [Bacteroidota bacterium]